MDDFYCHRKNYSDQKKLYPHDKASMRYLYISIETKSQIFSNRAAVVEIDVGQFVYISFYSVRTPLLFHVDIFCYDQGY